ncbi:MAG: sugar phosphate nucleotidyltransferase [Candidatus Tyrphobacter sp.]
MILAGGLSTRLYPLTKTVPKPLVPVLGEPNAVHVMRYLKRFGVSEIATNVFYFADAIRSALGNGSRWGVHLTYLDESELSGSAGAVKLMETFLQGSDPFIVIGCDDVTDLDLDALVAFHRRRNAVATIALVERDDVSEYGVVVTADDGRIVGFQEKPARGEERSRLANTGVYVFSPGIFERIPSATVYDFGRQVFPALQESGAAFYGFLARDAYWCDIGTPDEYRRVTRDLLTGAFALPDVCVKDSVWIGERAIVAADAVVAPRSVVGDGVVIEARARVEASIIWEDAVVGSGAIVRDSIVGKGYRIAPEARIVGAIVAPEA